MAELSKLIHVTLLGNDLGLSDAIARTLGPGFIARRSSDWTPSQWLGVREYCDVVLLDLRAAGGDVECGLRVIDTVQRSDGGPAAIVLCDEDDRDLMAKVLDHGVYDTIHNPPNMIELRLILRRACKIRAAEKELRRLSVMVRGSGSLPGIIGGAPRMQELFALARKIAPCDVNVLITGETGTGKELLASAIHHMSARVAGPLVAFSCANLPETLIEDELFGHEKGAFTGAATARRGRLEAADQGTVFLDEVGDIGLSLQPKLLRVLQARTFERLGSNTTINANIRVVSATNRNLSEMVQQGKFREDLFYRLNVVHMHIPALRERREDIPLLAQHFVKKFAELFNKRAKRFSRSALLALEEYSWPGNVRELENVVQRAVVLSDKVVVDCEDLPDAIQENCVNLKSSDSYEDEVRQFKRRLVLRTLQACGGSIVETARTLGVARGYLHRLINQLEIRGKEDNLLEYPVDKPGRPQLVA
ncbi:MAG: sigma-54 dependent transcriptional regulator [Candidatus Korobacteraceae bacterium]|jgi:two-component system response regulator AtoC